MSPFDYIAIACAVVIVTSVALYLFVVTKEDYDDAGVHIDDHNSIDLAKVYRDPIGFEPHGSRDTFVPSEVDTMSTDEFIADLDARANTDFMGVMPNDRVRMKRALAMLVGACELLDQCVDRLPSDIDNEDLVNKVSNWLVRGHQD